jgi:hypothetical protein
MSALFWMIKGRTEEDGNGEVLIRIAQDLGASHSLEDEV